MMVYIEAIKSCLHVYSYSVVFLNCLIDVCVTD